MINNGDIIADMHTHTIFSEHGYSSVKENIEIAKKRHRKYLAVTDHYYGNGDDIARKNEVCRIRYMEERINPLEKDITIIGGTEFNIGQEVYKWDILRKMKWRPIGLHSWFIDIPNTTLDELYHKFCESVDKHNCFVHIERELHKIEQGKFKESPYGKDLLPLDIKLWLEAICIEAKKKDIFLEVNESSLVTNDGNAAQRLEYWLEYAKQNGNMISLGSDAHYCLEVGKFSNVLKLLNKIDYPKELILNCNEDMILGLKGLVPM